MAFHQVSNNLHTHTLCPCSETSQKLNNHYEFLNFMLEVHPSQLWLGSKYMVSAFEAQMCDMNAVYWSRPVICCNLLVAAEFSLVLCWGSQVYFSVTGRVYWSMSEIVQWSIVGTKDDVSCRPAVDRYFSIYAE